MRNILFISTATLKTRMGISFAADDKMVTPIIKAAQDMFIQPALGSDLYLRLQDGIDGDNLTSNEENLLDNYITDCLLWATMAELPYPLVYQFHAKGILQKKSEEDVTPGRTDIEYISQHYQDKAEFYKKRLIDFLKTNANLYYQYEFPGSSYDTIRPENTAYQCPIYIGGDVKSCGSTTSGTPSNFSNGMVQYVSIKPAANLTTFEVEQLSGRFVLAAFRNGWDKDVVTETTTSMDELQIVGSTVTLPTNDVTNGTERFKFIYK
jgi:hypothetical protein